MIVFVAYYLKGPLSFWILAKNNVLHYLKYLAKLAHHLELNFKMTKALSNGKSQKWSPFDIFNFQVNFILYWWSHSKIEIPTICLFTKWKWNMYIGFWALKLRCTKYRFCGPGILQECKDDNFFWSQATFSVGFKKFLWGCLRVASCGARLLSHKGTLPPKAH